MPFSGVEWTFQARDLGFMEEIESDEESKIAQEELEMSEIKPAQQVQHITKKTSAEIDESSLDSIMED